MNILFFDLETNGLPKDKNGRIQDVDNWPRCIQLAWELCDLAGNTISQECSLIYPEGWEIPDQKFWIDNGFNQFDSVASGVAMEDVLNAFINDLNVSDVISAHNLAFDYPVLCAEMIRYDKKPEKIPDRVKLCTMQAAINVTKIPFPNQRGRGPNTQYKWPKLEELYRHLFKKEMKGAHDAGDDVTALKECFFEMLRQNLIEI